MDAVTVRNWVDLMPVPFMDIRPSDVLLSNEFFQAMRPEGRKTGKPFFLWAQGAAPLSDIRLRNPELDPFEYDELGNPILKTAGVPELQLVAELKAREAGGCEEAWGGKCIPVPRSEGEFSDEDLARLAVNTFGYTAGFDQISDINDGWRYFNKDCWVLRGNKDLKVHPMALVHFISRLINESMDTADEIGVMISAVLEMEIDQEDLLEFHATQAASEARDIRFSYQAVVRHDYAAAWSDALEMVSGPVIRIADVAAPFERMGLPERSVAARVADLNNKLGALFMTSSEYEVWARCGGLGGGVPFRMNDPDYSTQWLKLQSAYRGQSATRAFFEVAGHFRRVLIDCSSSPIERVFARKLLRALPSKEMVLKRSDIVLMDAFFEEHGSTIARGETNRKATDSGGDKSKEQSAEIYDPIYRDVTAVIQRLHDENPDKSWTKVTNAAADEVGGVSAKTLRKKFNRDDFRGPWKVYRKK